MRPLQGAIHLPYALELDASQTLITGSDFCFAGVNGLAGTPTAPTGWTAADLTTACPIFAETTPSQNSAPAVLYSWTGGSVVGAAALGTVTFESTSGVAADNTLAFGATAKLTNNNLPTSNQGFVVGPSPATVPEPGTFVLLGAGLLLAVKTHRSKHA